MIRRPPRSTLFPDPTLIRSREAVGLRRGRRGQPVRGEQADAVDLAEDGRVHPRQRSRVRDAVGGRDLDAVRSEEHTFELQSRQYLVCRLLLEKKKYQDEYHP